MRRTSVSLPTNNKVARDPYEKRARYEANQREVGLFEKITEAMSQARQTRWFKTLAVLVVILFLFFFLSPSGGVDLYKSGGTSLLLSAYYFASIELCLACALGHGYIDALEP